MDVFSAKAISFTCLFQCDFYCWYPLCIHQLLLGRSSFGVIQNNLLLTRVCVKFEYITKVPQLIMVHTFSLQCLTSTMWTGPLRGRVSWWFYWPPGRGCLMWTGRCVKSPDRGWLTMVGSKKRLVDLSLDIYSQLWIQFNPLGLKNMVNIFYWEWRNRFHFHKLDLCGIKGSWKWRKKVMYRPNVT